MRAALKDFDFYKVFKTYIAETVPMADPSVYKFDLENMQPSKVTKAEPEEGVIYKLILADKAKIKRLSNYSYDQIPNKLTEVMVKNNKSALPARITVYEDYSPGAARAIAVFVYSSKEKYAADITDLNQSGRLYDIKPDYAVKYSPK
jgi:hypothetical protein